MADNDWSEIAYYDLFDEDKVPDDAILAVKGEDLKNFLRFIKLGVTNPALACSDVTDKVKAHQYEEAETFCDIRWMRDDILKAVEHVYGIELDKDCLFDEARDAIVEMVSDVIFEIGDDLQDRSTEFGYELIYEYLPDKEQIKKLERAQEGDLRALSGEVAQTPVQGSPNGVAQKAKRFVDQLGNNDNGSPSIMNERKPPREGEDLSVGDKHGETRPRRM